MSQKSKTDHTITLLYGMLLISSLLIFAVGIIERRGDTEPILVGLGALAVIITAGLFPIASTLSGRFRDHAEQDHYRQEKIIQLLQSIDHRLTMSDIVRHIAYHAGNSDTLRQAIQNEIQRGNLEAALAMAGQMEKIPSYRLEGQALRQRILDAQAESMDKAILDAINVFEQMLSRREWDAAMREAKKLRNAFPDSKRVQELPQHVREAREMHKTELERKFLECARRDDVESAMELLKELDHYLTEAEAAPLREVARGVIGKKRQNLGVQFKMSVADHEWIDALHVGEQIIEDFPNTQMAQEVRNMLDLLRERAAGQQAAARANGGF